MIALVIIMFGTIMPLSISAVNSDNEAVDSPLFACRSDMFSENEREIITNFLGKNDLTLLFDFSTTEPLRVFPVCRNDMPWTMDPLDPQCQPTADPSHCA